MRPESPLLGSSLQQITIEQAPAARPIDREALRQQIRHRVDEALQAAAQGQQAAAEGSRAAAEGARAAADARATGMTQVYIPPPPAVGQGTTQPARIVVQGATMPPEVAGITYAFFITVAAVLILRPLMGALARRLDRQPAPVTALPAETQQQIARIEQTVEAMAIEVERISEGQRFAAKLLAERERVAEAR